MAIAGEQEEGKAFSSMVVFVRKAAPTADDMFVRMCRRRHTRVEVHQWGRQPWGWD